MTLEVENSRYPKTKFLSQQAQLSDYSGPVCLLESAMTNQYEDEFPQTTKADHMDQSYVRSAATTLTFIVCCALALRLLVVASKFLSVAAPSPDHGQFGAEMGWVARSLASGQGFSSPFFPMSGPTALVPPLFPYLLSQIFRAFGIYTAKSALVILSLDSLFSALTCVPIYLSLKYAAGERPAQMAAWLWAIYPFAVYFSGAEVWDYALTSLLFACCFCFAQRLHLQHSFWAWSGFGALYGIATLSNPSVLSMFPFLLLTALWRVRQVGGPWLLRGLITTVALTVIVVPWAVRNERMMHAPSPVRDGFWLEFWAGNSGDTFTSNPAWAHPASNPVEMQKFEAEGETVYLAHKHTWAADFVRKHPFFFAGVSVRRAIRFWTGFWSLRMEYLQIEPLDIPKCVLLHLHHILHDSRNVALLEGSSKPCNSFSVTAYHFPAALLFNSFVNGLPAAHRTSNRDVGHFGPLRIPRLERVRKCGVG